MEARRRVNLNDNERRLIRNAHRQHPNNPDLRFNYLTNHPEFRNLAHNIRQVYAADRPRAMRRVRDAVRRELNE